MKLKILLPFLLFSCSLFGQTFNANVQMNKELRMRGFTNIRDTLLYWIDGTDTCRMGVINGFFTIQCIGVSLDTNVFAGGTGGGGCDSVKRKIGTDSVFCYKGGVAYFQSTDSIGSGSAGWSLTGNTGTSPPTNFIGTKDTSALYFKTNDSIKAWIPSKGFNDGRVFNLYNDSMATLMRFITSDSLERVSIGSSHSGTPCLLCVVNDNTSEHLFRIQGHTQVQFNEGFNTFRSPTGTNYGYIEIREDQAWSAFGPRLTEPFQITDNLSGKFVLDVSSAGNVSIANSSTTPDHPQRFWVSGSAAITDSLYLKKLPHNDALTQLLVRNPADSSIGYRDVSSLPSGGGGQFVNLNNDSTAYINSSLGSAKIINSVIINSTILNSSSSDTIRNAYIQGSTIDFNSKIGTIEGGSVTGISTVKILADNIILTNNNISDSSYVEFSESSGGNRMTHFITEEVGDETYFDNSYFAYMKYDGNSHERVYFYNHYQIGSLGANTLNGAEVFVSGDGIYFISNFIAGAGGSPSYPYYPTFFDAIGDSVVFSTNDFAPGVVFQFNGHGGVTFIDNNFDNGSGIDWEADGGRFVDNSFGNLSYVEVHSNSNFLENDLSVWGTVYLYSAVTLSSFGVKSVTNQAAASATIDRVSVCDNYTFNPSGAIADTIVCNKYWPLSVGGGGSSFDSLHCYTKLLTDTVQACSPLVLSATSFVLSGITAGASTDSLLTRNPTTGKIGFVKPIAGGLSLTGSDVGASSQKQVFTKGVKTDSLFNNATNDIVLTPASGVGQVKVTGNIVSSGDVIASGYLTSSVLAGTGNRVLQANAGGTVSPVTGYIPVIKVDTILQDLTGDDDVIIFTPDDAPTKYRINIFTKINTISAATLEIQVQFTDYAGDPQTLTINTVGAATTATATGYYLYPTTIISPNGSDITIHAEFTGVSIDYDVGASIEKISGN